MRTLSCFAAAAIAVSLASMSASGQATPSGGPQIVVTGMGQARVTPDRATLTLGVQSRAVTAAAAAADNARRQRAILDTLRALGLTSEQISTENYGVSPEMQYVPNQAPKVSGYVVTNTVRAELRRLDQVGAVIDAALAKGANEVSSLQMVSSKADSVRRAALASAVANARLEAETLARAAGGSLGGLLELSSTETPVRPVFQAMARMTAATAQAVPTPIEAGEQTITASVTARWAFIAR